MSKSELGIFICLVLVVAARAEGSDVECINCNSADKWECAGKVEDIKGACNGTVCYTYLDNGITKRDCTGPSGDCKEGDPLCKTCDKSRCNSEIIPENRPTCIICDGTVDCISIETNAKGYACQIYSEKEGCYTYVASEKTVKRGCVADNFKDCTTENCRTCPNSDCNNDDIFTEFSCYNCTSENNGACKRKDPPGDNCTIDDSIGKCTNKVLIGRASECFTQFDGDVVIRGCSNTTMTGDVSTCAEKNCNSKCVSDVKCHVCDSSKDKNCADPEKLGESKACDKYVSTCYHCENESGETLRGCGVSSETNVVCKLCRDDDCNKDAKLQKSCYSCDSKTDSNCIRNQNIETKFCKTSEDECYVMYDENDVTTRGCKSEITAENCEKLGDNCKTCNTHNCNKDILAPESLSCYVCNDEKDCKADQSTLAVKAVQCNDPKDQCFMYSEKGETMQRGCLAQTGPEQCKNNDPKCVKCSTNECNSRAYQGSSGLSCIQCTGDDESCPWQFTASQAKPCNETLYNKRELCYSLSLGGGKVERGCLSDNDVCTLQNPDCRVCYDSGCNTEAYQTWSCFRCRSDETGQSSCLKSPVDDFKRKCVYAPTAEKRGCYIRNYNDIVIRGCLSDLSDRDYAECVDEKYKKCIDCKSENCNNAKAPNKSTILQASALLCLTFVIYSISWFNY